MRCFFLQKECDKKLPKPQVRKAFVITAFEYPFNDVYNLALKKTLKLMRLMPERADQSTQLGLIICQRICQKIQNSEFIVVDVSKPNLNVFYELGLSYALDKKIIFIGQQKWEECLLNGLSNQMRESYIQYKNFADLSKKKLEKNNTFSRQNKESELTVLEPKILNILSEKTPIKDLHQKSIKKVIKKLSGEVGKEKLREEVKEGIEKVKVELKGELNEQLERDIEDWLGWELKEILKKGSGGEPRKKLEKESNENIQGFVKRAKKDLVNNLEKKIDNKNWKIIVKFKEESELKLKERLEQSDWKSKPFEIMRDNNFKTIEYRILKSRVCIIDLTHSDCDKLNSYMFFCLGMAHGFGREVIPISHENHKEKLPFDINGLWHAFYGDADSLQAELKSVMHEIDGRLIEDIEKYPFRKFWNRLLGSDVHIIDSAREMQDPLRGDKKFIYIDEWDKKAGSEIYKSIASEYKDRKVFYEESEIQLLKNEDTKDYEKKLKSELKKKESLIIIGSPNVSDPSEVLWSKVMGIKPYCGVKLEDTRKGSKEFFETAQPYLWVPSLKGSKENGYINVRDVLPEKYSSLFWKPDIKTEEKDNSKKHKTKEHIYRIEKQKISKLWKAKKKKKYGIIVIAPNPYKKDTHIIIVAGFSGVATFAIANLITNKVHRKALERLIKICESFKYKDKDDKYMVDNDTFEVLVECDFCEDNKGRRKLKNQEGCIRVLEVYSKGKNIFECKEVNSDDKNKSKAVSSDKKEKSKAVTEETP